MGLFGGVRGKGFDELVQEAREAGAVIVDVRDEDEFARRHVPGAINVPLGRIEELAQIAKKDDALYVYCASGARSAMARRKLRAAGFAQVINMGGISSYRGPVER